jgi:hypothetical protein
MPKPPVCPLSEVGAVQMLPMLYTYIIHTVYTQQNKDVRPCDGRRPWTIGVRWVWRPLHKMFVSYVQDNLVSSHRSVASFAVVACTPGGTWICRTRPHTNRLKAQPNGLGRQGLRGLGGAVTLLVAIMCAAAKPAVPSSMLLGVCVGRDNRAYPSFLLLFARLNNGESTKWRGCGRCTPRKAIHHHPEQGSQHSQEVRDYCDRIPYLLWFK